MKKQSQKYVVLMFFAIVIAISVILMGSVKINYNISDYLDESTETKISLNIIEKEFGEVGNIQVMVEGVSVEKALEISKLINNVPNVLLVNFNEKDENYYKDGNALFAVIVDGDEYSSTAAEVLEGIKSELDTLFEGQTNYGGAVVEKINMRNTMKSEIVIILAIAIVFAMGIMLLMATSWIEPAVLLLSSGVAVLINMGTNAIFGEISYITNAVAAILQLALSVDYSIVLLHNYRAVKKEMSDDQEAMLKAIKVTIKPVAASALTTIAGLIALLFMTMKIGFDIGIVLTKGIVISAVTALTLLPAMLLVFDKLMQKTSKKDLVISGKKFCTLAFKGAKAVVLVALALIIAAGCLQTQNGYVFTDSSNPNQKIIDTFGSNSTVVVVYPKGDEDWNREKLLAEKLSEFKTADGYAPLKNYTAYSNTVRELYTIEMAVEKLNIPRDDVKLLFELYHLYNNDANNRKLTPFEFVEYSVHLLENDEEAQGYVDETTLKTLQTLLVIKKIVDGSHTASEMHNLVSTGVMEGTGLTKFQVEQMYGLYLWDEYDNDSVDFDTVLNFMVYMSTTEDGRTLMDDKTVADLAELSTGLIDFKKNVEMRVTREQFIQFAAEKFGEGTNAITGLIFDWYSNKYDVEKGGTAKVLDLLNYTVNENALGVIATNLYPPFREVRELVNNYVFVYETIDDPCPYTEFLPLLDKVVLALTGGKRDTNTTEKAVQQGYIRYYYDNNFVPNKSINGREFVDFVNKTIEVNPTIASNISETSRLKLSDVAVVDKFLSDATTYNYKDMTAKLNELQANVKSLTAPSNLSSDAISGIYLKYVNENMDEATDPVIAGELLNFIVENMNTNELLSSKMTPERKAQVADRQKAVQAAGQLFIGDTYNRMLLSVDLPSESEESSRFVQYLIKSVKEIYGEEAYVAGHMVSTYELQQTFENDNKIITIFTIVSIFLIIALVFKSLSLPVVLVAVIQGAIWICMSMSLITGPMFFMSYIIATCILMGSTIDYGILMSTNYLDFRKTMDKKEALLRAVVAAMPTVFTSGLILIICGFIVGMVASLTSISTVGMLLGKGTLVSVLMITLVLPSILYLLDGFILKLTHKGNKKENK